MEEITCDKTYREHTLIKVLGITVLAILILVGAASAAPFAYVMSPGNHSNGGIISVIDTATNKVTTTIPVGMHPSGVAITSDGTKVYVVNYDSNNVSVIDTATNNVIATVDIGYHPVGVAVGPFIDSNMTDQSTKAISNATEDIGVEETNLSSSEEEKAVEFNNSKNNSESDNGSSSSGNESSKNNSTPGFVLFESLTCLYGGWKFRKK